MSEVTAPQVHKNPVKDLTQHRAWTETCAGRQQSQLSANRPLAREDTGYRAPAHSNRNAQSILGYSAALIINLVDK